MEQLISTPVTAREILVGKLVPYFAIGLADAALCVGVGIGWFAVPFRGTVATLFVATALFLVVVLGIGFMISVAIRIRHNRLTILPNARKCHGATFTRYCRT